ncbi:XRE family transcriptional regulator [bacterium]|nr:XRE family transcriptional regulator [bacterium]
MIIAHLIRPYIREARTAYGWTQEQLAQRAGVSASAVSQAERGGGSMLDATARNLLTALNLSQPEQARILLECSREVNSPSGAATIFAQALRNAMKGMPGLTIELIAARSGRSIDTIRYLVEGKTEPSWETVQAVANGLKVPLDKLFQGVES